MSDSIFIADDRRPPDRDRYVPTEHARGPWDPRAQHGGASAALIAAAFERLQPGAELPIARLSFEFLRPLPMQPLTLTTEIVRPGRRVQELRAELLVDGETVARGAALRVQAVPTAAAQAAIARGAPDAPLPPVADAEAIRFALDDSAEASFATAMEMRSFGDIRLPGPARVWMRPRHPLLDGQPMTPLARLAATADFGNGVSASLPFERFLFINADLTVHLLRQPIGEWIGLDSRTLLIADGSGTAESVLHDECGPLGRAFQTLVVQPR